MRTKNLFITGTLAAMLHVALAQTEPTAAAAPAAAGSTITSAPDAAKKPAAKAKSKTPRKAPASTPFNGKIEAVDRAAMTITLSGKSKRVLHVSSQTRLTKDGKPAVFANAVVGETVGGTFKKGANGRLEAVSIRIGPKPQAEGAKKASPAKTTQTEAAPVK